MYSILNVFEIKPYDGWTILPGIIHVSSFSEIDQVLNLFIHVGPRTLVNI